MTYKSSHTRCLAFFFLVSYVILSLRVRAPVCVEKWRETLCLWGFLVVRIGNPTALLL